MQRFLTTAEAADAAGLALSTFYRERRKLRSLGFPEPLPWNRRLYLRSAVIEWIETAGEAGAVRQAETQGGAVVVHPAARAATAKRIAERARRRAEA